MDYQAMIETEQVLLNMVYIDNATIGTMQGNYKIDCAKFYDKRNQLIFATMQVMREQGIKVDPLSVVTYLRNAGGGKLEEAGGAAYIAELEGKIASIANLDFYAKRFAENWKQRFLKQAGLEFETAINEHPNELDRVLKEHEEKLEIVKSEELETDILSGETLWQCLEDDLVFNSEHRYDFIGVPCGITKIDEATRGFRAGELIVLAAVAGGGKSAMADTMIYNILTNGYRAALFSLEMSREQILERLASIAAKVPLKDIRGGWIEKDKIENLKKLYFDGNFFLVDAPLMDFDKLVTTARQLVEIHKVDIIFIDYAQLIRVDRKGNRQSYEILSELADNLKALSKALKVPIVALSQLNSDGYKAEKGTPELNNLSGGLAFTKSADLIFIIYYKKDESGKITERYIKVAKGRNIPRFQTKLVYNGDLLKFENPS